MGRGVINVLIYVQFMYLFYSVSPSPREQHMLDLDKNKLTIEDFK